MRRIHVIHENQDWSAPLFAALEERGLPYADWHVASGVLDLSRPPPQGVFYNRMSASSHTRGHRYSPEYTSALLSWLEHHGARVVNASSALRLELSKVAQYTALDAVGVRTPRTIAAMGRDEILSAAAALDGPFVTKHNRAGKGLGVRLFRDRQRLAEYLDGGSFEPSVDGITLVQQYIESPSSHITRVEFVGGQLLYAVRVDTSQGFELCPADACAPRDAFCPAGATDVARFEIIRGFDHALVPRYLELLAAHQVEVAAFEFVTDAAGRDYTYDINTNTNYNSAAESRAGMFGMRRLAGFLGRVLADDPRARRHAA